VSKLTKSGVPALSAARRRFLSGMLRSGLSLAAADALGAVAFAGEKKMKPVPGAYDYIIVGAGSAGCVLADRLSAAGFSILVIEAGTGNIQQPKIADAFRWKENFATDTDWQIPVAPQPELNDRSFMIPAGRAVGGTGSTNGLGWVRPDVRDLAILAQRLGQRWSVENMYAAMRRAERFVTGNSSGRSLDGKITVGRYSPAHELSEAMIQAGSEVSMPFVDSNAGRHINGMGLGDSNRAPDGRRSGPAQTYFADAISRSNLELVTDALVTKVLIQGNVCVGVECVVNGKLERFHASRDVILSAGGFGSPKILMLSGVGRERDLRRLGVEVVHHLPAVGANFQDHFVVVTSYTGGPAYVEREEIGHFGTAGWASSGDSRSPPDLSIVTFLTPAPQGSVTIARGFSIIAGDAKPTSRGRVIVQSRDPRVPVLADPAYLSESRDVKVALEVFELALEMGAASALRPYVGEPAFDLDKLRSRQARLQFIRENGGTDLHPTSSCAAGTDPTHSVVSTALKVWGIRNLRVVDASVLPEMIGVTPQLTIIGIAELASEIMLQGR
jgi:choline dehydrogenase